MFQGLLDGRAVKRLSVILTLACVTFFAAQSRSFTILDPDLGPPAQQAAETYVLPITPPLDQGDSGLCWVYATLSMLETNYISRHPGAQISLSRAALQLDSIEDRFERLIRGEAGRLEDGGLAVEALELIERNGLLAEPDFHDIVDSDEIFASIGDKLGRYMDPAEKLKQLEQELRASLGAKPDVTHLGGKAVSPEELAQAVLGGRHWVELDLARDGVERWGPSQDPDARPETRVRYVKLDTMIDLIHRSLAHGNSVVAGSTDHALLIYGGDYDKDGKPLDYLIKDSFAPYTYRASADEFHRILNDVTVAL
jgi:hypothetical protein